MECAEHGIFEDEAGKDCPICGMVMARDDQAVLYVDGAGWNGRVSRWCIVSTAPRVSVQQVKFTNNEMEYAALLAALDEAPDGAMIRTDSQLVVGQVVRGWKINAPNLRGLAEIARKQIREKQITLVWIPRDYNLAGQHLEQTKGVR